MESQPILYGKDVNTGAITQLNSIGKLLMLSNKLNDLSDVDIVNPIMGQTLRYEYGSGGNKWVNTMPLYISYSICGFIKKDLFQYNIQYQDVLDKNKWTVPPTNMLDDQWIVLGNLLRYRVDVKITMSTWDINTETNWEGIIVTGSEEIISSCAVTQFRDYYSVSMFMTAFYKPPSNTINDRSITVRVRASNGAGEASGATIDYSATTQYINASFSIDVQEM